jgi:hypothetical protein
LFGATIVLLGLFVMGTDPCVAQVALGIGAAAMESPAGPVH